MLRKSSLGAAVAVLVLASAPIGAGAVTQDSAKSATQATPASTSAAKTSYPRGATLKPSTRQVVEGTRLRLTATVKSAARAKSVTLQRLIVPEYYGDPEWTSEKKLTVRSRVTFTAVATQENTERYRVVVTYSGAKPATSKPVSVTVWRWIPLDDFAPYYETSGVGFGSVDINGQRYNGWGPRTYSHAGSWEARFTPGRHCSTFSGVLGLSDISDDGSSGAISMTADDVSIYTSPTLTPGMDTRVTVPLKAPYRIGIQVSDTSTEPTESWPVIGDPALLCTGI